MTDVPVEIHDEWTQKYECSIGLSVLVCVF